MVLKDSSISILFGKLHSTLEQMHSLYEELLNVIINEREYLIKVDINKLNENNHIKESFLYKVKALDLAREKYAKEIAYVLKIDTEHPRLMSISEKLEPILGEKIKGIHLKLEKILEKITEFNKDNKTYTESALNVLGGALKDIKDTLVGSPVYEKKGVKSYGPEKAGNLLSMEA